MSSRHKATPRPPGRTAVDDARAAFAGVEYHYRELRERFGRGLHAQQDVNEFHSHIRGFLWEMVATRDVIARDRKRSRAMQAALDELDGAEWFRQVKDLRNHTHQGAHVVEVMRQSRPGAPAIAAQIVPINGDVFDHFSRFAENMAEILRKL